MKPKQVIEVLERMQEINKQLENDEVVQALDIAIDSLEQDQETKEKMWAKQLNECEECEVINNEWVDVRDRLPNKEEWYLTTHEHGEVILHYFTFKDKQFVFNHPLEAERRTPVIAWRPLPKPYERKE